ncbi:MAG: cyclic nucleotide-binding domain-containing protein [Chitinophagales bacterium]|nr:cyclic nucleotide-binding domain-containing protein [Chitinophagales bacterium]
MKVWLISKHHFLQGLGIAFIHITAVKLFFKDFNPDSPHYKDLAIIIIIAAVIQLIAGRIYAYFEHHAKFEKLQKGVVASLILIALFFTISLWIDPKNKFLIFGLLTSYYLIYQISNLELWGVASLLFDVRQGKRLFSLISIGNIPAKIIGYFSYLVLYKVFAEIYFIKANTYQIMLAIGFLSFLGSYSVLNTIIKRLPLQKIDHHLHHHGSAESIMLKIFKSPFIFAMGVLSFCAYITFYPIEYKFLLDANNTEDIAAFIAVYYGVLHVISGLFQTFFSNRIIQKYGVLPSLMVLPVLLFLGSLLWLIFPQSFVFMKTTLTMSMLVMLIWVVVYYSLYNPLFLGLFQPLDAPSRLHGHTVVKGLINPLAMLVAGLIILGLNLYALEYKVISIIVLTIFSSLLFIFAVVRVNKQYTLSLQQGIQSKFFRGDRFVVVDQKHIHIIEKRLQSDFPADIIYSLDVLHNVDIKRYKKLLIHHLTSVHPDVQMYCLQKISEFPGLIDGETIIKIANESDVDQIRKIAVELYCRTAEFDQDIVNSFMESENVIVRKAALTGLIKRGDLESVVLAGQQLLGLMYSDVPEHQIQALEIIGDLGIRSYYKPVLTALKSDNEEVRNKGIEISAEIANPKLLTDLLIILYQRPNSQLIRMALAKMGEPALDELENIILKDPPVPVMKSIIRICEKVSNKRSAEILVGALEYPNTLIQNDAASALNAIKFQADSDNFNLWYRQSEELLDRIYNYIEFLRTFEKDGYEKMVSAMWIEVDSLCVRLFNYLSFIYDHSLIQRSKNILFFNNPGNKANALETLDQQLPGKLSRRLIPIVENPEELIIEVTKAYTSAEIVNHIVVSGLQRFNRWTLAIAIQNCPKTNIPEIGPYLFSSSIILHDTAVERVKQLNKGNAILDKRLLGDKINDSLYQKIQSKLEHEQSTLLTIEKVIALKGTSLFSNIPENLLIDIAEVLQVDEIKKGDVLFNTGDTGNCMYIIYEGVIRIHSGSTVFAILNARDFFGEFALLDTQPRSATATADEDSLLLKLNQDIFYELLTDDKEFAKGFLKTLTQRLRDQNEKLMKLEAS